MKLSRSLSVGVSAVALLASTALAQKPAQKTSSNIQHVLLISIDGMHAVDFLNCANGITTTNNGQPFCPNLAALSATGINYTAASTSKPSDSFPGLTTIVTGGSPAYTGIYYDVAYSRDLSAPAVTTGNGLGAGPCTPFGAATGTTTEYEEGIDIDKTKVNGGAPGASLTDGGHGLHRFQATGTRPQQRLRAGLAVAIRPRQQHLHRDSQRRRLRGLV